MPKKNEKREIDVILASDMNDLGSNRDDVYADTDMAAELLRHARFRMPVLPLRGVLVFPHSVVQLDVGREKSIRAVNEAVSCEGKEIILAMTRGEILYFLAFKSKKKPNNAVIKHIREKEKRKRGTKQF